MADLDTLIISDLGLININKKIVGNRTFANYLITTVGEPYVSNGIAYDFSPENYFTYSPLKLEGSEKIDINFKGVFNQSSSNQCAWELLTSENSNLTLIFNNKRVILFYKGVTVFSFGGFTLKDETEISAFLTLESNSCTFTMNYGQNVVQRKISLDFTLPLAAFTSLRLGNSSADEFWAGNINLNEFSIYNNGALLYAPSEGTSWNFSHILISDGEVPLSDDTLTSADHTYSFPINQISRSGNTTLLTSVVSEEVHLIIREIGLYIQTPSGRLLFGSINNLNIDKAANLSYNLVIAVNTYINVLNAIGFPAENDIVIDDPEYPEFKDYTTVQQVNTYVLTNLERIIRMNAGAKGSYENSAIVNNQAGIGHNRAQVIYRLQQEIEQMEDVYNSVDTFVKLTNRLREIYKKQIDFENLEVIGSPKIVDNAEVSKFSNSNYIKKETSFQNTKNWSFLTSFTTGVAEPTGTIGSLGTVGPLVPLKLYAEDGDCYLNVEGTESIRVNLPNTPVYDRNVFYDKENNGISYYGWETGSFIYYNFHCNIPLSVSPEISSPSNRVVIPHEAMNSSSFTLTIRAKFNNISDGKYLIEKADSNNESIEIYVANKKLTAKVYEASTGDLITNSLVSRYDILASRYYNITLSYTNGTYTFSYKLEPESSSEYATEEVLTFASNKQISLAASNIQIGSTFDGVIDFSNFMLKSSTGSWIGCSELDLIYTQGTPYTAGSPVYDDEFYPIYGNASTAYYSRSHVLNQQLFPLLSNTRYDVLISYSESSGNGTYSLVAKIDDRITSKTLGTFPLTTDLKNRMSIPNAAFVGVTPNPSNPFNATINLAEWEVRQNDTTYSFGLDTLVNNSKLLQYYRIPDLNKNQYTIEDMCDNDKLIKVLGNEYEGNSDLIDFSYEKGFTLCMKVNLKDAEPKVLLYKTNTFTDTYFSFTFLNQTLNFTMVTGNGYASLFKKLDAGEYESYTSEPVMLTIVVEPQYGGYAFARMYKNNEAIITPQYIKLNTALNPSIFTLSNFIEDMPTYEVDGVTRVVEPGRYVSDIVVVEGAVSKQVLFYINNLFDTNY